MRENRSVPITFRIYADSLQILREYADREDLSSNTLLNKILKRWIGFELSVQPLNPIMLPSNFFLAVLNTASNEEWEILKQQLIPELAKTLFSLTYDTTRSEEIVNHLEFMSKYSGWFSLQLFKNNNGAGISGSAKFILKHGYGIRWSLFLKGYLEHIVKTYYHNLPINLETNNDYVLLVLRATEQMQLFNAKSPNDGHSGV